jgi:hypothetical protein
LALDSVRTNFYENEHDLFYFGVFNPKDAKILVSIFGQKNSKNSQVSLDCPREDERSNMLLEASKSAHITIIKLDT